MVYILRLRMEVGIVESLCGIVWLEMQRCVQFCGADETSARCMRRRWSSYLERSTLVLGLNPIHPSSIYMINCCSINPADKCGTSVTANIIILCIFLNFFFKFSFKLCSFQPTSCLNINSTNGFQTNILKKVLRRKF